MNITRKPIAAGVGILMLAGTAAGVLFGTGIAFGDSSNAITSTTTDVAINTTGNTPLGSTGGAYTSIESFSLPKGKWVLHSDATMINFGPSEFVRCGIFAGATDLGTHAAMVGDPSQLDNQGAGALGQTVSGTSAVTLTAASTTISLQCEHDTQNGASEQPYIDANANLWAHKATSLVILSTP
jgi:hypothetical protein